MENKITELEGCLREIEISLSNEELEPHYDKAFKKARPNINLDGFRKGKVPMATVKKLFGKQIKAEAEQDIISEVLGKVLHEEKVPMVGDPALTDIKRDEDKLTFKVQFEVVPKVELKDYRSLEIDEPVHAVDDEEIQKEIEKICQHNGDITEAEKIEDEQHIVNVKLTELDRESGEAADGVEPQITTIYLANETVVPELRDQMIGLATGEEFVFSPKESDQFAPDKDYKFEIQGIQKLTPKEFTDEFVKEYTKEKFEKADDFREEIGFKLQENWDQKARQMMEEQIMNTLVDAHEFEVPEAFVKNVMEAMVDDIKKKYFKPGQKEAEMFTVERMGDELRPVAQRNVRWELIRNSIIENEKLEVEDHDLEAIIEAEHDRTKTDKETIRRQIMGNQNFMASLLARKAMDLIMDFTTTNEISFEEYEEKYKPEEGEMEI